MFLIHGIHGTWRNHRILGEAVSQALGPALWRKTARPLGDDGDGTGSDRSDFWINTTDNNRCSRLL